MRRSFSAVSLVSVLVLAGCGGSTAGTGEEPIDTGSLLDDTGSIDDDGSLGDSGATDSGAGTDSGTGTDSGGADSPATDSAAGDSAAGDSGATDSGATDSGATDSGATDSGATDSGATDSGATDSGATDSGATDSGVTDTGTDTGSTGLYPVAGKVSCSGDGTTFCAAGQVCCGRYDVLSLKWGYKCDSSCIAARGFDCDETADCPGKVCCADYVPFTSTINGSTCRSSCDGAQLCMSDAECGAKKCTPFKAPDLGITLGSCK